MFAGMPPITTYLSTLPFVGGRCMSYLSYFQPHLHQQQKSNYTTILYHKFPSLVAVQAKLPSFLEAQHSYTKKHPNALVPNGIRSPTRSSPEAVPNGISVFESAGRGGGTWGNVENLVEEFQRSVFGCSFGKQDTCIYIYIYMIYKVSLTCPNDKRREFGKMT